MSPLEMEMRRAESRRRLDVKAHVSLPDPGNTPMRWLLPENAFVSMLYLERRRAERAKRRFVLVLADVRKALSGAHKDRSLGALNHAISQNTRETDIIGWHVKNDVIGLIGTELGEADNLLIQKTFLDKIFKVYGGVLGTERTASISVSFHFFPEEYDEGDNDHSANIALYPEFNKKDEQRQFALGIKRCIDILGSLAALLLFAPVFAAISLAIKLSSKGPVFFKQERLGEYGKPFTLLKFRSMRTDCDARIHQQYVSQFIAGKVDGATSEGQKPVFKIRKDPRITRVGQFVRKTSLDELPQFWNVLRGDMLLVGRRPPIAYEFCAYDGWHRRRVLEIKPGITGLWQVKGRSRTRFDDMVRLDLRYARDWSIWLDLRILLQTPAAVILGEGAH